MTNKFRLTSVFVMLFSALTIFGTSCKSDDPDDTTEPVVTIEATSIEVSSGADQSADASTELAEAIVFVVKGSDGAVLADVKVDFAAVDGVLSLATANSNSEGKVVVSWTLGATVGDQTITATAYKADGTTHVSGSPVTVTATAVEVVDPNVFTDVRDSKEYSKVTIGTQVWMKENLNFVMTGAAEYDGGAAGADAYGLLYNGIAAKTACPAGWHLPTEDEWQTLEMELGMTSDQAFITGSGRGVDEGGKLKATGTDFWDAPNTGATNSSNFSAIPGGYSTGTASSSMGTVAAFWTSTGGSVGSNQQTYRELQSSGQQITKSLIPDSYMVSVRCVED